MSIDAPTQHAGTLGKILVVDDNNLYAKIISFKLRGSGYRVATALDGAEAISAAQAERPDLILLDITFPPDVSGLMTDGFGIIEWLHRMEELRNVPFIVMTGDNELKNRERALTYGAAGFFHKPVNYADLLNAIRTVLDAGAPQSERKPEPRNNHEPVGGNL